MEIYRSGRFKLAFSPAMQRYLDVYKRQLYKRGLFLLEGGFLTVKQPYNTTIYNTALYLRLSRDDELQGDVYKRQVRTFCIGKKNWMFHNTAKGAGASALVYSISETAKLNNLRPYYCLLYTSRPAFQMAVDDDIIVKNPFGFQLAGVLVNDSVTREAISKD